MRENPAARALSIATRHPRLGAVLGSDRVAPLALRHGDTAAAHRFARAYRLLQQGMLCDDLDETVSALLQRADHHLERGRENLAVEWADMACLLAFHHTTNTLRTPAFIRDPDAFHRDLLGTRAGRLLFSQPDAPVPDRSREFPEATAERPRRVLILSQGLWTFAHRVRDLLEADPCIEVRTMDLGDLPVGDRLNHRRTLRARWAYSLHGTVQEVPQELVEPLEWADEVFLEWGSFWSAWMTLLDLRRFNVRLTLRIHRFELFTPYAMTIRMAAVDRVVFVSDFLERMGYQLIPRLPQTGGTQVVSNAHDFSPFAPAQQEGDEFVLAQVGWAPPIKDVVFTLEVLEALREHDSRYRLLLIGPEPATDPRDWKHHDKVMALRERLGDAVEVLGFRDDVPELLGRAGFLMSSSLIESAHEAVPEGASAGAVPVVRNWPFAAPWNGARSLYPDEWVVEDVAGAVARILAHRDPQVRQQAGLEARAWVQRNRCHGDDEKGFSALLRR